MDILWFALVGIVAGALAKAIMPGDKKEPKGCLWTMMLGIGGSILVGWTMRNLLGSTGQGGLISSIIGATIGACALIWLMRKFLKD